MILPGLPNFRHLRSKLTVLYAGLFAVALGLVAVAVYGAISANAQRAVRNEMTATGTVFDRIWALRTARLHDGADLLAHDYGFREAVGTRDAPTIQSALDNLKGRLGVDLAFIMDMDGEVIGLDPTQIKGGSEALWYALDANPEASGVFVVGGQTYQAISAPVLAPTLAGWVVFGARLDQKEMSSLEQLSAIPLSASVMDRRDGQWTYSTPVPARDRGPVQHMVERGLAHPSAEPVKLKASAGPAIALVKPLDSLDDKSPAALVLRYPLALALAPYRSLLAAVVALALAALALLAWGSWVLARSLTRPISALDDAAHRLQRGETVTVAVETRDEIGRLAESFNTMAAEIHSRELKITHMALHDAETGLPNSRALEQKIDAHVMTRDVGRVVVLAVGVDRFQFVRGAIGYRLAAGLVAEVGARLAGLAPEGSVARLATSTLGLVLTTAESDLEALAARLLPALEQPVCLGGDNVDVTLSIGIAALPGQADIGGQLVERALIALDQARAAHAKAYLFDAEAYGDPASNLSLISDMMSGLDAGHISLHYQPKLDLRAGAITSMEALLRWRHPGRGAMRPDIFVPMAEETGHIRPLTDWVLQRALDDQAVLRTQGFVMPVAVNLSGRLLGDHDFAAFAKRAIAQSGGDICLEITETAVIDNPEAAFANLAAFSDAGCKISIDDYGSGLSSLAYLKQIRADELKMDKSFVTSMADSGRDAMLVKSTVDLGHSLGLKVVAEGVETAESLALLTGMGCDLAQGYLIAKPMPLQEMTRFLSGPPMDLRAAV